MEGWDNPTLLGALLVFTSLSFVKGRFDLNLFSNSAIIDIAEVKETKVIDMSLLTVTDSKNPTIQKNLDKNDLAAPNEINSSDDDLMKADQKIITKKIDNQDSSIIQRKSNKDSNRSK